MNKKKIALCSILCLFLIATVTLFALYSPRRLSSYIKNKPSIQRIEIVSCYPDKKIYEFTGEDLDEVLNEIGKYKITPGHKWDSHMKTISTYTIYLYSDELEYTITSNALVVEDTNKTYEFINRNVARFTEYVAQLVE